MTCMEYVGDLFWDRKRIPPKLRDRPSSSDKRNYDSPDGLPIVKEEAVDNNVKSRSFELGKESLMGNSLNTWKAALWAANVVVWSFVYIIDRNGKSEAKRIAESGGRGIVVDLSGEHPIQIVHHRKMVPEFTIYQV